MGTSTVTSLTGVWLHNLVTNMFIFSDYKHGCLCCLTWESMGDGVAFGACLFHYGEIKLSMLTLQDQKLKKHFMKAAGSQSRRHPTLNKPKCLHACCC